MDDIKYTNGGLDDDNDTYMEQETKADVGLDNNDDDNKEIVLKYKGLTAKMPRKWARISVLVKRAIESDEDTADIEFHDHPFLRPSVFNIIIEYMNHHQGVEPKTIEKPLRCVNLCMRASYVYFMTLYTLFVL